MTTGKITNADGAFGYTGLQTNVPNFQGDFKLNGTVTRGMAVVMDTDGTVGAPATTTAAAAATVQARIVGIAEESGVSGDVIRVTMAGATQALVGAATTVGQIAILDVTSTAGYVSAAAAVTTGDGTGVGVILSTSSGGYANIFVKTGINQVA